MSEEQSLNRLLWCYKKQMSELIKPLYTFEEWCILIDACITETKRREYERAEIESAQSMNHNPNTEAPEDLG
jgi:hypothetical protein